MTEQLREHQTQEGQSLKVDRERGLIPGVKILGRTSKNGREYTQEAIAKAAGMYEGVRVNVDHRDPGARRSYADRLGMIQNVQIREDGLYGDLRFNTAHSLAEQLIWDAENAPRNVGFSHDAQGRTTRRNGRVIVEEIEAVKSVDLVADPATTAGLFESATEDQSMDLKTLTLQELRESRGDLVKAILGEATENKRLAELEAENKTLREEIEAKKAETAKRQLVETIDAEIKAAGLERDKLPAVFVETLQTLDAPKRAALIEDRKTLAKQTTGTMPTAAAPLGDKGATGYQGRKAWGR